MPISRLRDLETTLYVRFPAAIADVLRKMAHDEDRPLSALIRKLVRRGLEVERKGTRPQSDESV